MAGLGQKKSGFRPGGAEQHKALAIIFVLFMALLYKQTYWDPYFHPPAPQNAVPGIAAPVQAPKPAETAAPDTYEELAPPEAAPSGPGDAAAKAPPETSALPPPGVTPQGFPTDGQIKSGGRLEIRTKSYLGQISLLGGRLVEFFLNDYKEALETPDKKRNMVEHIEKAPLPLGVYSGSVNDAWVLYQAESAPPPGPEGISVLNVAPGEAPQLVLRGNLPDGRSIVKTFHFSGDGYLLDVGVELGAPAKDGSKVSLEWTKLIPKDSPQLLDPYHESSFVWFDGKKAFRENITKVQADTVDLPGVRWISLTDIYFMASLISPGALADAKVLKTGQLYRGRLSGSDTQLQSKVFIGPKNLEVLDKASFELKRNINFGRFAVIAAPLSSLLHYLFNLFGNYGLAVVMLTIIVKICLYPLTASSYNQMKAMQDLAPEMQKLKESITDKQQQQLAMMELYKKKNVNPLGGCLPMLLQMPVFFGLFSALQISIELRHAPFVFWIHDLSAPEKLMIGGMGVPVMVILFVISMLIQQWTTPSTMDATQKRMMLLMPLIFGFMFASMPAGLTLYWLTNNIISICQQVGLRKGTSKSAFQLTAGAAAAVFCLAFILVKISAP